MESTMTTLSKSNIRKPINSKRNVHNQSVNISFGVKVHVEIMDACSEKSTGTILCVNGSLSTSSSFYWALKMLPDYTFIFFDLPHSGKSKQYNEDLALFTIEQEVAVLRELNEYFIPSHIMSMSWGGFSALLLLSEQPKNIKAGIISSFSDKITPAMTDYLKVTEVLLRDNDIITAIDVFFNYIGEHLPAGFKKIFSRYFLNLTNTEWSLALSHFDRLFTLDDKTYKELMKNVACPCLFINGTADRFTSPEDALNLAHYIKQSQFTTIPGGGHFLALENETIFEQVRHECESFIGNTLSPQPNAFVNH